MKIVRTISDKCRRCYACVRNCPAKAIRVKEGKAEVMKERCIACGTCVKVCAMGAKEVESGIWTAWHLLREPAPVIAILSSVFPAAFPEIRPGQLVTALRKLGFSEVMEVAFGAELIAREYHRMVTQDGAKPIIFTSCPAVVEYIERFYPQLINKLAPLVSPMIAMGRLLKKQYDPEAKVIFIGACVAKKAEAEDEKVAGMVDAVLTIAELKEMLAAKGIALASQEVGRFSGPKPNLGRMYAVSRGLLKVADLAVDVMKNEIVIAEGKDAVVELVREFDKGNVETKFLELLFCKGCLDGPAMENDLSLFKRKEIVTRYTLSQANPDETERDVVRYAHTDLSRRFTSRFTALPVPSEDEIRDILVQMNKAKPHDQLDCGACGYSSCRELAVAAYQGLAEIEMCWPYLVDTLEASREQLIQAEKLTSLGQMAASIAHEINNPLAGVLVYTKLMSKKLAGDTMSKEVALDYLAKMEAEISHSARVIRNLLDFARQTEPVLRLVDARQAMEQALSLVEHQAKLQNIEVIREFSPSMPKTMADFDQLRQVFANLLLNAIQAMPNGGRLNLRISVAGEDQSRIRIDVEDSGCGIPKENMRKLFTPFFTTKEKGKGVGLGLAVAHGIIERHGGKIEVQSQVGKGTTFTIYLGIHHGEQG